MITPTENVVAELRGRSAYPGDVNDQAAALIESQRATIERVERERDEAWGQAHLGHSRAEAAEARVTALEAALKPFAKAAEDCDVGDDIRIGVVKPADVIWESAAAASITFGHLNTAAQALSRSTEKNDG